MLFSKIVSEYDQELPQSQTADNPMATREEPLNHQVLKTQSWLCHLLIHVLFKRMVKHRFSKYGWLIYNRCFHDEYRKQGKFKHLDVVWFDHKNCVLANKNLNVNYMYFV